MEKMNPLAPEALFHRCDPEQFSFQTTAELGELVEFIGQERAVQAVRFGVEVKRKGFNLYVMGPPGSGKHSMVKDYLGKKSQELPPPWDWCYVNNFEQSHKPRVLRLPAGRGRQLKREMEQFIEELSGSLPAAFESDEYRTRVQSLEDELKERQEQAFAELSEEAEKHGIKLFRTPGGFAFAPTEKEEVVGPEEFAKWPPERRHEVEETVGRLQERLQEIIKRIPQQRRRTREQVKQLNKVVTLSVVGHLEDELKRSYSDLPEVLDYLDAIQRDIVENVKDFLKGEEPQELIPGGQPEPTTLHRYKVNVLVDNGEREGAPIVYLDNPTYLNLVGRAEHLAQFGTLVTDFTLLKPGALHEANGGYLIVDAHKLLIQPYAWEGLKRALYAAEVRIESLEKMLSLVTTISLEPQPIPLDVKVIILGDRLLYYLLHAYDPDFAELFKVVADFDERVDRTPETYQRYAELIGAIAKHEQLRPLDRYGVARVIEHGARLAEDSEKLSTHMRSISDVLSEADHLAREQGTEVVSADHVQRAIDNQIHRNSRIKERTLEAIHRGTLLVDTEGSAVGQINGLSVVGLGDYAFGQPSRITATAHIGEGHLIDIEREVELGGAIHSKGVLILSSFLAARYATDHPLSLSASLVFEQSYGMVEGDSASLAELCSLISTLAELPIRQSLAVTGSVNQHGQVQPIGGVNEKIEGFFDVCRGRGLTGEQGVVIPLSNVKHLMLRQDVVEAARNGQFHIYAVERVDQALALLMATPAGERDAEGRWTPGSINARVQERLTNMSLIRQTFAEKVKERSKGEPTGEHEIRLEDDSPDNHREQSSE